MSRFSILFCKDQHRRLWSLAIPIIISNISVPLLGLVDTAMVGHLAEAYYLAAVALGSTVISLMIWLCGFLRMSTTGLTAQASDSTTSQAKLLVQGTVMAVLLGLLLLVFQQPIIQLALALSDTSDEVAHYFQQYVSIRIWSMPLALVNLVFLGWLLGKRLPKVAMWQLIIANSVNILLDLWFIWGLGWGVAGAAWASVCADITAFAVASYFVIQQWQKLQLPQLKIIELLKQAGYQQLLSLNRDIFIRSLCLQLTLAFMTFYAARLGDHVLAANAVLLNLLLLISYALDGVAYYAEVEVGEAYGKKQWQKLTESVWLSWFWSGMIALGFAMVFYLLGPHLIALLTDIPHVRTTANNYVIWLALLPLLSFGCYLFDGVYIGLAKGKTMRNSMIFSTLVVFFPLWWLTKDWGNHALWLALSAFLLSRSLTLGLHFLQMQACITSPNCDH
ncbi:MATE family efflux transporter [Parashewanella curva]|uniref:MATE family efflux transporter n=1 Tax=Parashewanella curva TaxID=2338552 RepID=A0A3L8PYM6_9GAMM|nr:MATE family efflux transporter [Parashewanella curva]RLV60451.1 MATE family efflux transporter [Parashewanella curva]